MTYTSSLHQAVAIIHHLGEIEGGRVCVTAVRHLFNISFVESAMTYTSSLHQHQDVAINHHLGGRGGGGDGDADKNLWQQQLDDTPPSCCSIH